MYLKRITEPAELPLTLDEVKAHLRVDGTAEDALLTALISAATEHVQNITNRQLIRATFQLTLDSLPSSVPLPRPPFAHITSITATDEIGQEVVFEDTYYTYTETDYSVVTGVTGTAWYDYRNYKTVIEYEAGYEDATKVPAAIKQAMLLIIGHLYENREDHSDRFPKASDALLSSYRIHSF